MNTITTTVLALLLVAGSGFGREEFSRDFSRNVPVQAGGSVSIGNKFGSIVVRAQPQAEVSIAATIKVSAPDLDQAKQLSEKIQIDVQQNAGALEINTRYPDEKSGNRNVSYSVDYNVVIPDATPLIVRNSFWRCNRLRHKVRFPDHQLPREARAKQCARFATASERLWAGRGPGEQWRRYSNQWQRQCNCC